MGLIEEDGPDGPVADQLPDPSVDGLLVLVGVCVDISPALAYGLERTGRHQKLGYVALVHDAGGLLSVVRDYLVLCELELAHGVAQGTVKDLPVELPEERRTVLHEDDVAESGEDGGVCER